VKEVNLDLAQMRPAGLQGDEFEVVSSVEQRERRPGESMPRPQHAYLRHNHNKEYESTLKNFKPPRMMDLFVPMVNREQQKLSHYYSQSMTDLVNQDPDADPLPSIEDALQRNKETKSLAQFVTKIPKMSMKS